MTARRRLAVSTLILVTCVVCTAVAVFQASQSGDWRNTPIWPCLVALWSWKVTQARREVRSRRDGDGALP